MPHTAIIERIARWHHPTAGVCIIRTIATADMWPQVCMLVVSGPVQQVPPCS